MKNESVGEYNGNCQNVNFNDLPIEIIQFIFSFMTVKQLCSYVAPVCQYWSEIMKDPIFWRNLNFDYESGIDIDLTKSCLQHASLLKSLSLCGRDDIDEDLICRISQFCPMIREIDMSFSSVVDRNILKKCSNLHNLEDINLEGCKFVNDECLELISYFPSLNCINLSNCYISSIGVEYLSRIDRIITLNIENIEYITDEAVTFLVNKHSLFLKHLYLDGENLSDDAMLSVSKCIGLKTLSISFSNNLTDESLRYFEHLNTLNKLKLKKGEMFSLYGLSKLFSVLSLEFVCDLCLAECHEINDDILKCLALNCGSSLKIFDISWCWGITDKGIDHLMDKCLKMNKLILVGLHLLTGLPFNRTMFSMPNLCFLDLTNCNMIDDTIIQAIVGLMPKLIATDYYGDTVSKNSDIYEFISITE